MNTKWTVLFGSLSVLLLMGFTFIQQEESPQNDDVFALPNGSYILERIYDGGVIVYDTLQLEQQGIRYHMSHYKHKQRKPYIGFTEDNYFIFHSVDDKHLNDGGLVVRSIMEFDKDKNIVISGYGVSPKVKTKSFQVKMYRVALPFYDTRDGEKYEVVQVGNQFWMAENLRFRDTVLAKEAERIGRLWKRHEQEQEGKPESQQERFNPYYNLPKANVDVLNFVDTTYSQRTPEVYGRLYTWDMAKTACPRGWHLPTKKDWNLMMEFLNKDSKDQAGLKLKTTKDWITTSTSQKDSLGFSAYPAGYYNPETNSFFDVGEHTFFWSSTEDNRKEAYYYNIFDKYPNIYEYADLKNYGLSCRCIQD